MFQLDLEEWDVSWLLGPVKKYKAFLEAGRCWKNGMFDGMGEANTMGCKTLGCKKKDILMDININGYYGMLDGMFE